MKIAFYSIVISLFLIQGINAQVLVKGIISDETGIPLPGASVVEKGTVNGVSSDFDGNYNIEVPKGSTLEFSFIGYGKQTFLVGESTSFDVTLYPDNELEEVVVVAFGKQTKETIVVQLLLSHLNQSTNSQQPQLLKQSKVVFLE